MPPASAPTGPIRFHCGCGKRSFRRFSSWEEALRELQFHRMTSSCLGVMEPDASQLVASGEVRPVEMDIDGQLRFKDQITAAPRRARYA